MNINSYADLCWEIQKQMYRNGLSEYPEETKFCIDSFLQYLSDILFQYQQNRVLTHISVTSV